MGKDVGHIRSVRVDANASSATSDALTGRDVALIEGKVRSGDTVVGTNMLFQQEAFSGARSMKVGIQAGGAEAARLMHMELQGGRWLLSSDDGQRACMVGYDVWNELLGARPLPGLSLVLNNNTRFEVIGVFRPKPPLSGGGDGTWRLDRKVWVSDTTFRAHVSGDVGYREIMFRHGYASARQAQSAIAPALTALHRGSKPFRFDEEEEGLYEWMPKIVALLLYCAAAACMSAGALNVTLAQLVLVGERSREYAVRRALGMSPRQLRQSVILESVRLATVGGVVGVAVGWTLIAVARLVLHAAGFDWALTPVPWSIVVAIVSAAMVGLVAALMPTASATGTSITDILRRN